MPYENILVETHGHVGLIKLNRPKALNALSDALVTELAAAVDAFEADDEIGCIVLTGSERAFAAGADIKEMAGRTYMDVYLADFITKKWEQGRDRPQAGDRRGGRLRAGRRLRAGHDVRLHHRRRHRQVRPAGDQPRHHSRRRRHPAPDPRSSASPRRWTWS